MATIFGESDTVRIVSGPHAGMHGMIYRTIRHRGSYRFVVMLDSWRFVTVGESSLQRELQS